MAFRGYFEYTLDAKNRLTIPAKFAGAAAEGVVVALQRDAPDCVAIWSSADFAAYVETCSRASTRCRRSYGTIERFYSANWHTMPSSTRAGRVMRPGRMLERRRARSRGRRDRRRQPARGLVDATPGCAVNDELTEKVQDIGPALEWPHFLT